MAASVRRARTEDSLESLIAQLVDDVAQLKNKTSSAAGTWVFEERGAELWAISYEQGREVQVT